MVEQSRRACSAVANGEADCAIIGGDVPDELAHVLKVRSAFNPGAIFMLRRRPPALQCSSERCL